MNRLKQKLITGAMLGLLLFSGQAANAEGQSDLITRAEFVVMLTSTLGWVPDEEVTEPFADVPREKWYSSYLSKAKQMGLITGQKDGTFQPEAPITRAEVAVLLQRAYPDLPVIKAPIYFTDVHDQHWAESAIAYATMTGLLQGYDQHTFGPNRYMKKGEAERLNSRLVALDQAETAIGYTVQQGDTLWKLAHAYGTSVEAIMEANQLPDDRLQIGQKLFIPVSKWQLHKHQTLLASNEINLAESELAESEPDGDSEVELIDWSLANQLFAINYIAKITDVYTGKSFYVKRLGGINHADVEPLTKRDTEMMHQIWGGPTWETRPVLVEVEGRTLAAAMHNMPHDIETIADNDYPGHTCIHFLGSTKHNNGQAWPEMQRDVLIAATYNR